MNGRNLKLSRSSVVSLGIPTLVVAFLIGCGGGGEGTGMTSASATGVSATGVTATSTSATATTTTATTSTATTSTATTSTGTTAGDPGVLPKNKIFYDELQASTVDYRYIDPSGSGDTLFASLPFNFSGLAPNPVVANQYFFGGQIAAGSKWRIYRNSTISFSGAVSQTPSISFDFIGGVQVANNGKFLLFTAATGSGSTKMYYLELKSPLPDPVALDDADRFHISSQSDKVVYSKPVSGKGAIFTRPLPTGTSTNVIDVAGKEDVNPQFNKTATKIVFSSDRDGTFFDIYVANVDGTDVTRITNTPDVSEAGASFNEAGDTVAYVGSGATTSLVRLPIGGTAVVLKESAGLNETRWTGSDGKAKAGTSGVNVGLNQKRRPAKKTPSTIPAGLDLPRPDLAKPDRDLKDGS